MNKKTFLSLFLPRFFNFKNQESFLFFNPLEREKCPRFSAVYRNLNADSKKKKKTKKKMSNTKIEKKGIHKMS